MQEETHDVDSGDEEVANEDGTRVVSRVAHLTGHAQVGGRTSVGKDERRDGGDGVVEGRRVDDVELLTSRPVASRRIVRLVLDSNGDGESENGRKNGGETDPSEDGDLAEGGDRREDEDDDGDDGNEDGGAGSVGRDGVETDGDTEHGASSDHRHDCERKDKGRSV